MDKPEIYFYIPNEKFSDHWPKSPVDNWEAFAGGAKVWSYLTPIALREYGFPVQVTTKIPDEGIVLSQWRSRSRGHKYLNHKARDFRIWIKNV